MGDDSCLRGRGFKLKCLIQDGHDIFTLVCYKNCIVFLKRPKINEIEARVGPFLKKKKLYGIVLGSFSLRYERCCTL